MIELLYFTESQSGDLHTVNFETGMSDFEYTQLLWKIAGS